MTLEEELRLDEEESRREAEYIRETLPIDIKERFSDTDLLYIIDTIVDYYYTSGVLDTDEEEVDIDMYAVANYVCDHAKKDHIGTFYPDDMLFVVQADLDFQEQNL